MRPAVDDGSSGAGRMWPGAEGERCALYESFDLCSVSVEYFRFQAAKPLQRDARQSPSDRLEFCLNFQGNGTLRLGPSNEEIAVGTRSVSFYPAAAETLSIHRHAGVPHRFVTVRLSREFLVDRLAADDAQAALRPEVRGYLMTEPTARFAAVQPMSLSVENIARALLEPPVPASAQALWYEAKVLELMTLLLYRPAADGRNATANANSGEAELFCARHHRLARERVRRAQAILERDMENPPTLEMLAATLGCGSFHLSRTFSQHTGCTIPQYLRRVRLERAARLLREGRCNVTEAAMAVGYNSLSHFSKAFWEQFGCCPGLYGNPKLAAAVTRK